MRSRRGRRNAGNASTQRDAVMTTQAFVGFPATLSPTPLPTRFRANLRYSQTAAFTTGAAGVTGTGQLWRLNSLFDPDQTGVGHQPYGFDVLTQYYSKYLVVAARWTITATTIGGSAEVGIHAQVFDNDGFLTIVGATYDAACERTNVATALVSPSGNTRTTQIKGLARLCRIFGVTEAEYAGAESLYAARFDANPTKNCGIQVAASSPSGTAAESVTIQAMLEYEAFFYEPFAQGQS